MWSRHAVPSNLPSLSSFLRFPALRLQADLIMLYLISAVSNGRYQSADHNYGCNEAMQPLTFSPLHPQKPTGEHAAL